LQQITRRHACPYTVFTSLYRYRLQAGKHTPAPVQALSAAVIQTSQYGTYAGATFDQQNLSVSTDFQRGINEA